MTLPFFTLQELLLPGFEFSAPEEMYVRRGMFVTPFYGQRRLQFRAGGAAQFDTYYNSISVGTWKRATIVDSLSLMLEGQGRFLLRVGLNRLGQSYRWLLEQEIALPLAAPLSMPWPTLEDGMLFIALEALEDGELTGGRFVTATAPVAPVKLGAVITHFNRKPFVVPAIARIRDGVLRQPDLAGKIELIIVDNSSNLTAAEAEGAMLIPNQNFGGSGGFTRGLLHLLDHGFTHCLFMDDDATCEIDSLRRAYALQCFAAKPDLAISGALLRELEPSRLFEKGASFQDGLVCPLNHARDVRDVNTLLEIEQLRQRSDYGAWWFFCFKLSEVKSFPFPFFVRGDDIFFSILNKFSIETVNGISCWGEDFQLKENPATRYLGLRATLAVMLMHGGARRLRTLRVLLSWLFSSLFSYNYGSAEAILLAIRDVAKGPAFWRENMDNAAVRATLAPFNAEEKMQPICLADYNPALRSEFEPRWRRWLRMATLNGFLLPGFLLRDGIVYEEKSFRAAYRRLFRYRRVLYYYEAAGQGYVAQYDRKRFFSVLKRFGCAVSLYLSRMPELRRAYRDALPGLTSEAFWRDIYKTKSE